MRGAIRRSQTVRRLLFHERHLCLGRIGRLIWFTAARLHLRVRRDCHRWHQSADWRCDGANDVDELGLGDAALKYIA